MRHGRKAALVSAPTKIVSPCRVAMSSGGRIDSDGEDEVGPTETGGSTSRALLDRSTGARKCFAPSSVASILLNAEISN